MKPLSIKGSSNREPVLFPVVTRASRSLIHSRPSARLTKHQTAPARPVRLLAANGFEMRMTSSLSASVQLGSLSEEHHFFVCPQLQWKAILGLDLLGRFGGVLTLKNSQTFCLVVIERSRPAKVCSTVGSKKETSFEDELLNPFSRNESLSLTTTQLIH
ncbi:hypothetical protein P879_02930 [Paragonimus westermani]|uniref:Uncharacterized protein n=1 Tax=Paragonimus westermani TaxID=34504 RepID=A0A8T0DPI9_9TREM|nr:hypothetical protein P879_02930 [Paragonimus westermani]